MASWSLIVNDTLGNDRFVVTSNCRVDVPIGTVFNRLSSERRSYSNALFTLEDSGPTVALNLKIHSVDFWRNSHSCVPYGHHAAVEFEGDLQSLEAYLSEHPRPWTVFLDQVECLSPVVEPNR